MDAPTADLPTDRQTDRQTDRLGDRPSRARHIGDILLGLRVTLALVAIAAALGIGSFVLMSSGAPLAIRPNLVTALVVSNLSVLMVLAISLAGRITRVWVARRRGSAGSRLHVRLVLLFSVVAVIPTILVGVGATALFSLGIQFWFNDRIRTALQQGEQASQGYLAEHRDTIKTDALAMKSELEDASRAMFDQPSAFREVLENQTLVRGLDAAVIFEPSNGHVLVSAGLLAAAGPGKLPPGAAEAAAQGEVPVLSNGTDTEVRALVQLGSTPPLLMVIERPVDPTILAHMHSTEDAVAQYERLDQNRANLQVTFAAIFALVALLVLSAAVSIGLLLANQIARPIGWLMQAAERVRGGDLGVRVPELGSEDELASLSRAFNRMTNQLSGQRAELMSAYSQIDERRRFTETVLSGVSAGVIGLDGEGRVELPNRAASALLGLDLLRISGQSLCEHVPEMRSLLAQCMAGSGRPATGEIQTGGPRQRRTLLVRIAPEMKAGRAHGFVVTFDDITELQSAQRKAAWADVARRIAHEIKNPLTPIQLAAERLKRRFAREITSDPETFEQCADTIVRHVGDIGRMVDEFSAFARMPVPVIRPEDIGRVVRESMVLQRSAHPEIEWTTSIPERGPMAPCDRRQLGQALTNLLVNAADSVAMRAGEDGPNGHIHVSVQSCEGMIRIAVEDDGIGLPQGDHARLTEPYVTHKPKGTGLGLAIVKKIMEDHGGSVTLDDRQGTDGATKGAVAALILPETTSATDSRGTAVQENGPLQESGERMGQEVKDGDGA
jgi:two-component system nitrogen regulation sensor histidine kinase NtrY